MKPSQNPIDILTLCLSRVSIRKTQSMYLQILLMLWLIIPGRINFTNLGRYYPKTERSHRSWFEKPISWLDINSQLILHLQEQNLISQKGILAIDAVFVPKYGRHTPDVGNVWNGCAGRNEKGLEGSCLTWVSLSPQGAKHNPQPFPISVARTPLRKKQGSRVDAYVRHMLAVLKAMPIALKEKMIAIVGDAYYTKKKFIEAVLEFNSHFIGRLRKDANLRFILKKSNKESRKPGRPKKYGDKIAFNDFSAWEDIGIIDGEHIYSICAYHVGLKRIIRVVAAVSMTKNKNQKVSLFFSTDTELEPLEILSCYHSRFAMEFPFRDAKQFAGLSDCQSRQPDALDFHWNMSFAAVSFVRASQLANNPFDTFVFSMEDEKRLSYNAFFAQQFLSFLPQNLTCDKFHSQLLNLLQLGVKAA